MKIVKTVYFISMIIILLGFVGCGRQENVSSLEDSETQENVMLGSVQGTVSDAEPYGYFMTTDVLYYIQAIYNEEGLAGKEIYRKKGEETEEKLAKFIGPKQALFHYFADSAGAIYYLYGEMEDKTEETIDYKMYLRKDDSTGVTRYCNVVDSVELVKSEVGDKQIFMLEALTEWQGVNDGVADAQGGVCLYSNYEILFVFDEKGQLVTEKDIGTSEEAPGYGGLVNAGEDGCYYYHFDAEKVTLQKIDMTTGALSQKEELPFQAEEILNVFSGYENGILITTDQSLYRYIPSGGEEHLLDWGTENIHLSGEDVVQVCLDEEGYQVLQRTSSGDLKQVRMEMVMESDIPDRQIITLGMEANEYYEKTMQELADAFNETSTLYKVKLKTYSNSNTSEFNQMYKDMVTKDGPDIYELIGTRLPVDVLASHGVLEDLTPYFEQSTVIKEEDVLPKVMQACHWQDKLVSVVPRFQMIALIADEGCAEDCGWTREEFLAYAEAHSDTAILNKGNNHVTLLSSYLMAADMEEYIDWESRTCNFDSPEFVQLLKDIKQVKMSDSSNFTIEDFLSKEGFVKREYLIEELWINTPDQYAETIDFLEEQDLGLVGYPNQASIPYFLMSPDMQFGINGQSDCKEGAWAFLEYLLSEEVQDQYAEGHNGFPVRKSAFENSLEYIKLAEHPGSVTREHYFTNEKMEMTTWPEVTEEHRKELRFMAENMYYNNRLAYTGHYKAIIVEEVYAYFRGERTAEDVAANIQNRVGLFLSE